MLLEMDREIQTRVAQDLALTTSDPSQEKSAFIVWSTFIKFCQRIPINRLLFGLPAEAEPIILQGRLHNSCTVFCM